MTPKITKGFLKSNFIQEIPIPMNLYFVDVVKNKDKLVDYILYIKYVK